MKMGRVIAVVGPSGVGKDSVMAGIVAADGRWGIAQRVITRDAAAVGEDFQSVTEAKFKTLIKGNAFCLHWTAHGLKYGIPHAVLDQAKAGQDTLVNLSRSVLENANRVFADFAVLNLTASAQTLDARLEKRGRESREEIKNRRLHAGAKLPDHLRSDTIHNDGPFGETIDAAQQALFRFGIGPKFGVRPTSERNESPQS